jgi:hypothetical protein
VKFKIKTGKKFLQIGCCYAPFAESIEELVKMRPNNIYIKELTPQQKIKIA